MNRSPGRYRPDNSSLYPINVSGKYGFMDRSGKTVITPQFDGVIGFSEGLGSVRFGTKWGYINTKGTVTITPQFDFAMPFRHGRARVQLANRYGYIDKEGKYIGSPTFLWASEFSGEFAAVQTADRALALVNRSGKTVLLGKVDTLGYAFNSGLLPAASGGKWGFMDTTGKWVIDPQFEGVAGFADGRAPVKVGGRIGYVDLTGKFVVNPQYDQGNEFDEGYASFANGGKWGFIDTGGKEVCAAKFLAVGNFSDGLAPAQTEDGWGFTDKTCKLVVSPRFDSAASFQNGLAHVTALGKEAYVTTTGAFVVDPFPGTTLAAERTRVAAEAANAKASARSRVEQGIQGQWIGYFANQPSAILKISGDRTAELFTSGIREVFHWELLEDNRVRLVATGATQPNGAAANSWALDTATLVFDANGMKLSGQNRNAAGRTGPVSLEVVLDSR
jgi:hypothetical protein